MSLSKLTCQPPTAGDTPFSPAQGEQMGRADAVPWRCHRSFTADALLVRGIRTYEERLIAQTVCRVLGLPGGREMGHEDEEN